MVPLTLYLGWGVVYGELVIPLGVDEFGQSGDRAGALPTLWD